MKKHKFPLITFIIATIFLFAWAELSTYSNPSFSHACAIVSTLLYVCSFGYLYFSYVDNGLTKE